MTAIMDDVIGWTGFCVTGACIPWCGFTVQVRVPLPRATHLLCMVLLASLLTYASFASSLPPQVNTSLKAPVVVNSWLRVEGEITAVERRKVHVSARLVGMQQIDHEAGEGAGLKEVVHCEANGLLVLKK